VGRGETCLARWNPLSATATAIRSLFLNPGWQGGTWVDEHAILMTILWSMLLIAVFVPLSVRRYRRLKR